MKSADIVKQLLKSNDILVLATSDTAGKPWISPLSYSYKNRTFYWVSSKNALHSQNLRSRPEGAITIYGQLPDGSSNGCYFEVLLYELNTKVDVEAGLESYGLIEQPEKWQIRSPDDLLGDSVWRLYKAEIQSVHIRVDKIEEGRAVTARDSVNLSQL